MDRERVDANEAEERAHVVIDDEDRDAEKLKGQLAPRQGRDPIGRCRRWFVWAEKACRPSMGSYISTKVLRLSIFE
jgi:hypothetical protein